MNSIERLQIITGRIAESLKKYRRDFEEYFDDLQKEYIEQLSDDIYEIVNVVKELEKEQKDKTKKLIEYLNEIKRLITEDS